MANDWSDIIPYLSVVGLEVFRNAAVMPMLVNSDYGAEAASKGNPINVNIAPPVTVRDRVASSTPLNAADLEGETVPVPLDYWKEASFKLTDKEKAELQTGFFPAVARNAVIALAEYVNGVLLGLYKQVPTYGGVPGTTPFGGSPATTADASAARKRLTVQKALMSNRRLVLDPDATENANQVTAFQDTSASADSGVITEGMLGRKLGFDWYEDQQVATHTAGSVGGALTASGATAVGADSMLMADAGSDFQLKEGDRFIIAGDSTQYIVTGDVTSATATATVGIYPKLQIAVTGGEVITLVTTDFVANLAFHEQAFAFANRPLAVSAAPSAAQNIQVITDPQTGLSFRLEVERQNGQDVFIYDILFGVKAVYPYLATLIVG